MLEKIFKAYDVRATYPDPLNEDAAWKVGHATAQFLKQSRKQDPEPPVKLEQSIVVGRDMRPHSPALAQALANGIRSAGLDVIDIGMIDTSFALAGKMLPNVFGEVKALHTAPISFETPASSAPDPTPLDEPTLQILKDAMKPPPVDLGVCFEGAAARGMFLDEPAKPIGS